MKGSIGSIALAAILVAACTGCEGDGSSAPAARAQATEARLGLPEMKVPADNPQTPEKIALGKQLFFDRRLSKDGTASCESCHFHHLGWTDAKPLSPKVGGALNTRHTPTLYNVGHLTAWYWDGRAPTLEKQIEAAWKAQLGADLAEATKRVAAVKAYREQFAKVFGAAEPTPENVVKALAAFVRTLESASSAWDRYEAGDKTAVSEDAIAGYELMRGKAGCFLCHNPPLYMDTLFHNVGIGMDRPNPDLGQGAITKQAADAGKFKTPGLRSVTKTGPYFHDGSVASLEEAVRLMAKGGVPNPNLDEKLKPRDLSEKEIQQLLAFLKSLESTEPFERPTVPE